MASVDPRDSVRMAQAVLQKMISPGLIVDGRWGGFTQKVYSSAPVSVRLAVDGILALSGTNPQKLLEATRVAERSETRGDYDSLIEKEASSAGVSSSIMRRMLEIENPRRDPNAVSKNGSSHGLFQIQKKTWEGVLRNNGLKEPQWSSVYDPAANAKIACLLTKENIDLIRRYGYTGEIDGRILYLVHQQGPTGAMEIYQRANGLPVKYKVIAGKRLEDNLPSSVSDRSADGFAKYWWKKAGDVMN